MDIEDICFIVRYILYAIIIFIAFVYSCLILFVRRFHHQNNVIVLNLCINIIVTCIYFMIYFKAVYWHMSPALCNFFHYTFNVASVQIGFAFVAVTVHRFCSTIYHHKPFFKTKQWIIICIASQWVGQFVISLPFVFGHYPNCNSELWMGIYTFITAVLLPILINTLLNIRIFIYVQRSTRRIQPQTIIIISTLSSGVNNPHPKISRRDISLLKHMIFMFSMFIVGWLPTFTIHIVDILHLASALSIGIILLLSEICLLSLVIHLFIYNHEIREFLFNQIRRCFQC